MGFLFAAVIGGLLFVIGGPLRPALRAVNDEFPAGRGFEALCRRNGVAHRQCVGHRQRLLQDGTETGNPFMGAALGHPEQLTHDHL